MYNIFISKINNVPSEYIDGVNKVLSFFETDGFKRYTLGDTIFPTKTPFDEITELITNSDLVVILGIPKVYKSNNTTCWCQIEATMSLVFNKTTIIIKDRSIDEGIFSRGAANSYIYEVDMTNANWMYDELNFTKVIYQKLRKQAA